jgi:protocatechuate 4,5-dioxygenase beta chain
VSDPELLTLYTNEKLVELAGTQGVEFLNWIAMRGALTGRVSELHRNYHIPISNTAAATLVLDHEKREQRKAA